MILGNGPGRRPDSGGRGSAPVKGHSRTLAQAAGISLDRWRRLRSQLGAVAMVETCLAAFAASAHE